MGNEVKALNIFLSLKERFKQSKRIIEVLEPISDKVDAIKVKWNIPDDTLLGVVLYLSGGVIFDKWVRLLASGERDIATWNERLSMKDYIVVADDILGGLFGLKMDENSVYYFAPDTLEWEDMELTFSQFLQWLVEGDVDKFYEFFRWDNWKEEVNSLNFSDGIAFYPFLWAESVQKRHRQIIPIEEIVLLSFDSKQQMGI